VRVVGIDWAAEMEKMSSPSSDTADDEPAIPPPPKPSRRYDRSIIEGPLLPAVWKLAWPTMLQNIIGGMQGVVDHILVGHYVGFAGNAALGVSWQVFLVFIVFVSSLFTGMNVLVARFVGAGEEDKVNRTVYQACLTAIALSLGVLAPIGYFLAPSLLDLVNAAPEVQAEAVPYLRIMFVFSIGMLMFFMIGGALRSAGDARTPLRLGIVLTALNFVLNVIFIRGLGPIPAFGAAGSALGTVIASGLLALYVFWRLWHGGWVVAFPRERLGPDWNIIRSLFRFGLPAGFQGVAMNLGGVLLLSFVGSLPQSAAAQAAYAVSYTQLFALITWTSIGLLGAASAVAGQNLGAGNPDRASQAVHGAARIAVASASLIGSIFLFFPRPLLAAFGLNEPAVVELGVQFLHVLSLSGLFIAVALTYTGGLQGTGDTKSPLYITLVSQFVVPVGICFFFQQWRGLEPINIWLAILCGHMMRCVLSVLRFNQGKWRNIRVEIER
jgi:putative MATE family efflux protein